MDSTHLASEVASRVIDELAERGSPSEAWRNGIASALTEAIAAGHANVAMGALLLDVRKARESLRQTDDLLRRMEDAIVQWSSHDSHRDGDGSTLS